MPRSPAKLSIITSHKESEQPSCRSWHKTISSFHIPLHSYQMVVVLGCYWIKYFNCSDLKEKKKEKQNKNEKKKLSHSDVTRSYQKYNPWHYSKLWWFPYLDISDSLLGAVSQSFACILRWELSGSVPASTLALVHRNP